jgi:phage baseplate assembly protein W
MAKKKFLGCQYPIIKTSHGLLAQKSGVDQIKADLLQLLLTNPGERVMLPMYGTPLRKLFFEPNDPTLTFRAEQMIANAILNWEPRIVITQIKVTNSFDKNDLHPDDTKEELDTILGIKIQFVDPQNISEVEQLEIQLPIGD